jgi:hypothetical protein
MNLKDVKPGSRVFFSIKKKDYGVATSSDEDCDVVGTILSHAYGYVRIGFRVGEKITHDSCGVCSNDTDIDPLVVRRDYVKYDVEWKPAYNRRMLQ